MEALEDYTVCITRKMSWGQMDAFKHMNNIEYFRYFEDGRIAYFEESGLSGGFTAGESDSIGPILASTSCQFKMPLQYPATLHVGTKVIDVGDDRFTLEHAIADAESDRIAAVGTAQIVTFDYETGQKVHIPDHWREAMNNLEKD